MKQLIFAVVTSISAIVFAMQNSTELTFKLFFGDISLSLGLLIIVCIGFGLQTGLPNNNAKINSKNNRLKFLQRNVKQNETVK